MLVRDLKDLLSTADQNLSLIDAEGEDVIDLELAVINTDNGQQIVYRIITGEEPDESFEDDLEQIRTINRLRDLGYVP